MRHEDVLAAYAGAFADELARAGLRHVVFCPGSRSTPLAILFEAHPEIRTWVHLDERSAAFFALGMAKASRRPVAVLSTSGTAAANFLPAVIEAQYGRVPLLVLTADRPPELRDVGAPQTIDQIHLYGNHVKWFADAALPEGTASAIWYARSLADRALGAAAAAPAGPVHLNFPFREPLVPGPVVFEPGSPQTRTYAAPKVPEPSVIEALAADLASMERGLIVCGPQDDPALPAAALALSHRLGYPILADPLSQVRAEADGCLVLGRYDAFLRDPDVAASLAPEVVLRLGAIPTSKPLTLYLQQHGCRHILADVAGWNDPIHAVTDLIHADPTRFCAALARTAQYRGALQWAAAWKRIEDAANGAIENYLAEIEEPFEGKVFAELGDLLPEGATLWAGSSMPVRDLDTFFPAGRGVRCLSNRGANGIDGVISSALGAGTVDSPLLLAIGDLSFYHDMNGLLAAKLHDLDATIVLLNNDGGGIFSFLPQAGVPAFETLFGTPHGLDFRPAVEMYGGRFRRVTDWEAFREAVSDGIRSPGLSVVEVPTDRERNVTLHREAWKRVSAALAELRSAASAGRASADRAPAGWASAGRASAGRSAATGTR